MGRLNIYIDTLHDVLRHAGHSLQQQLMVVPQNGWLSDDADIRKKLSLYLTILEEEFVNGQDQEDRENETNIEKPQIEWREVGAEEDEETEREELSEEDPGDGPAQDEENHVTDALLRCLNRQQLKRKLSDVEDDEEDLQHGDIQNISRKKCHHTQGEALTAQASKTETSDTEDEGDDTLDEGAKECKAASLLRELYSAMDRNPYRVNKYLCPSTVFNDEDIPKLMRLLVNWLLGTWAWKPVFCVGNFAKMLPSDVDFNEISRQFGNRSGKLDTGEFERLILHGLRAEVPTLQHFAHRLQQRFHDTRMKVICEIEYKRTLESIFPPEDKLVLLNYTKGEVVHGVFPHAMDLHTDYKDDNRCLGTAVLSRLFWTDDAIGVPHCIKSKGDWVFNRLAIVTSSMFRDIEHVWIDQSGATRCWKDISKEVHDVIDEIGPLNGRKFIG